MAFADGNIGSCRSRLAEASAIAGRSATTIACVMGNLATYDGCLLQRCIFLPSVLLNGDGSGHLCALWHRSGSHVAGLQEARLAWLALAYSADRHCC